MFGIFFDTIISVSVGAIIGSVIGGFVTWRVTICTFKRKETIRAKREFKRFIIKFIVEIQHDRIINTSKVWKMIRDHSIIFDEEIDFVVDYLSNMNGIKIRNTYKKYNNPEHGEGSNKFSGYNGEKGVNLAIENLKEILEIVKKD